LVIQAGKGIPELNASVFTIPAHAVKNRMPRVVVLNSVARGVIEQVRGQHSEYVFTYRGNRVTTMNNSGWQKARKRVGLQQVRIHDLKHTFGRRLRAANVSFEDRQDLLGHKSSRITDHYTSAELGNLIAAAEKVCLK
jgi:integrase